MIQKADFKHLIKYLSFACFFIAFAMIIVGVNTRSFIMLFKEPVELESIQLSDIRSGQRVEADILYVYDYFEYSYIKDDVTTDRSYIIDAGPDYYMAIECSGSTMNKMDALMELYDKLLNNDYTQADLDAFQSIHISGTICKLEGKDLQYFNEYVDEIESITDEQKKLFRPYVISIGVKSDKRIPDWIFIAIFAIGGIVAGIIMLVKALTYKNHLTLDEYYESVSNKEAARQKIERFYKTVKPVRGTRINNEYFLFIRGDKIFFALTEKILWTYISTEKKKINAMLSYNAYEIVINLDDGKGFKIPVKNKKDADRIMNYIIKSIPGLINGYSLQYVAAYGSSHRSEMIEYRNKIRAEFCERESQPYKYTITGSEDK